MKVKSEYDLQAEKFLADTNTTFSAEFLKHDKYFEDDTDTRDIYKITLQRQGREFVFNFGQSLQASGEYVANFSGTCNGVTLKKGQAIQEKDRKHIQRAFLGWGRPLSKNPEYSTPSAYDVLACLTDYDPGDFEDFCGSYGYDTDSVKASRVYKAVVNEWHHVCMLWSEPELEQLREIN